MRGWKGAQRRNQILSLLTYQDLTVNEIVDRTGIVRQIVWDILELLFKAGHVSKHRKMTRGKPNVYRYLGATEEHEEDLEDRILAALHFYPSSTEDLVRLLNEREDAVKYRIKKLLLAKTIRTVPNLRDMRRVKYTLNTVRTEIVSVVRVR